MWKFICGLATGYLTLTPKGKKLTDDLMKKGTQEVSNFLKQEGVIEPNKDARPVEPDKPDVESEEQCSTSETVNE